MIQAAQYVRQIFCKHKFETSEERCTEEKGWGAKRFGPKISLLCKECGYHKSFWKY
jgi:hypothetical protein